jgi:hypothetical protein
MHAGDRGLMRDIRRGLSPDSFIVGRIFVELQEQEAWLDSGDPEGRGRAFADKILNFDYGYATERGANGRLLIDAWMSLNERPAGPAHYQNYQVDDVFRRRAAALDRFQVAFRQRLQTKSLEAVAFNFAAGNYTEPAHYLDWFPRTLESYTYLGFHEYGWPTLMPDPSKGTATAALLYRRCMEGIRQKYGDRHKVIITEAGLARMYKYPSGDAGDVGWLYRGETISQDQYWESLRWYNGELCKDPYVLGACLYQVGHDGKWETFRHLGKDNQGNPILLISKIKTLSCEAPPPPPPPPPPPDDLAALRARTVKVEVQVTPAVQQATALATQAPTLQQKFAPLPEQARSAAALKERVKGLQDRLNALQGRLAGRPDLKPRAAELQAQLDTLQAAVEQAAAWADRVTAAQTRVANLGAEAAQVTPRRPELDQLLADARKLRADIERLQIKAPEPLPGPEPPAPGAVPQPPLQDVRGTLPTHASLRYPARGQAAIRRIVVHHTATRPDVTPQRIAETQVGQGKPGITYHFLVAGDGTIYWTQPLDLAVEQTLVDAVNADGVAVALAGNFTNVVPLEEQMAAAANLIAWLLSSFRLDIGVIYGRRELDTRVASPGAQWLEGARYKNRLLLLVQERVHQNEMQ